MTDKAHTPLPPHLHHIETTPLSWRGQRPMTRAEPAHSRRCATGAYGQGVDILGLATRTNRPIESSESGIPGPEREPTSAADGALAIALEDAAGARLLLTDVRVALLLVDQTRHRAVARLFGVSREQSWQVTLIALVLLASAAHDKSDRMLKGPGGPSRSDVMLGAAVLRELLTWIPGPSSRDTPLVGTLVMVALVGAVVRPAVSRAAHDIRTSSHRARHSFNHRYGHLLPGQRREDKTR